MRIRYAIFAVLFAGLCCFAQQQTPSQQSSQDKPPVDAKQQQDGKPAPPDANPFPEAISRKAADAANAEAAPTKPAAPDYSSSHVDLKSLDESADRESRISNGAGGFVHDPQLAAQDDKIGGFYLQSGDFKGAYDRYKEATRVAPEDGNAVFGLAESARGLHRTQEALTNYTLYLDAFPDGKKSKEARKAMAALDSGHKK